MADIYPTKALRNRGSGSKWKNALPDVLRTALQGKVVASCKSNADSGRRPSPAASWGYLFRGRIIAHYEDHDEVFEQGQAFYMPPGHVPDDDADTEFVTFSPPTRSGQRKKRWPEPCKPPRPDDLRITSSTVVRTRAWEVTAR